MLTRMTKPTREKWKARLKEWRASGKSAEAFVADKDFEASSLRWAASQLGEDAASPAIPPATSRAPAPLKEPADLSSPGKARAPRFAPVRVTRREAPVGEMVIEVGVARIRVARGTDLTLLGDVVRALGGGGR